MSSMPSAACAVKLDFSRGLSGTASIAGTPPAQGALKGGAKADFFIQPSAIAEEAYHISQQDRSAWTFDHWIRPFGEFW